ncbi:MAG: HDOD domain-containing protein [Bacillaceae bacterium]|nr:HDOD domain-containing protein [Bacillaceae bacterium]
MNIFVARQPILTVDEEVIAYELLYRMSEENRFDQVDGDLATTDLLINSFLGFEEERLSSGKKLFINFTRKLLIKNVPHLLNKDKIVVEILEGIDADDEVLSAIKGLKRAGYTIALDDFVLTERNKGLLAFADMIKVDFIHTSADERAQIIRLAKFYNIQMLAEKVETRQDFETAIREGFEYFQGYFFSEPVILRMKDIPVYHAQYLSLLSELTNPEPNIDVITSYIERDLSLSYKLLKIVNTVAYSRRVKISSIKQAILALGLNELKKWVTILSLKEQRQNLSSNEEVIINSLIRAKLAEYIGEQLFGSEKKPECFMVGLFSLLETILQIPKEIIIEKLPLSQGVKDCLLGLKSEYNIILDMVFAVEKADWCELGKFSDLIKVDKLSNYYKQALDWATEINETVN